jgi:hypothetical protein
VPVIVKLTIRNGYGIYIKLPSRCLAMSMNVIVNQPETFERIATDIKYISECFTEIRRIVNAEREVTWQRYHSDRDDTFGKQFPTVSLAIFQLANLVGTPSITERAATLQPKHEAS